MSHSPSGTESRPLARPASEGRRVLPPAELTGLGAAARRAMRRWGSANANTVDVLIAAALFLAGVVVRPEGDVAPLDAVTLPLMAVAAGSLALRRSFPVAVWMITLMAGVIILIHAHTLSFVVVPVLVSLFTVGTQTRSWVTLLAGLATAAGYGAAAMLAGQAGSVMVSALGWSVTPAAIGVAWRGQRAAVQAAQARARQAENSKEEEARRRVTEERMRIAQELHDVMAHHVAVITVQAGVAHHLLDRQPEQARAALGLVRVVREAGRMVLVEMATILGLLRTSEEGLPTQPTPGLAQLEALVESMQGAGLRVTRHASGEPRALALIGEMTAYRIVQESLTNALKHGAGTAELSFAYHEGGLSIDVLNPVALGGLMVPDTAVAGSGHGLIGMRERIVSVGGQFRAGRRANGDFAVHAEIPRTIR